MRAPSCLAILAAACFCLPALAWGARVDVGIVELVDSACLGAIATPNDQWLGEKVVSEIDTRMDRIRERMKELFQIIDNPSGAEKMSRMRAAWDDHRREVGVYREIIYTTPGKARKLRRQRDRIIAARARLETAAAYQPTEQETGERSRRAREEIRELAKLNQEYAALRTEAEYCHTRAQGFPGQLADRELPIYSGAR